MKWIAKRNAILKKFAHNGYLVCSWCSGSLSMFLLADNEHDFDTIFSKSSTEPFYNKISLNMVKYVQKNLDFE